MEQTVEKWKKYAPYAIFGFDAAVLGVFFYLIPWMKRPLEFLFIATGVRCGTAAAP